MSGLAGSVDYTYAYRVIVLELKQIMMKSKAAVYRTPLKVALWLVVTSAGIFLNQSVLAAVTFTNTPAAVSNTYTGTISLQIGGLTNTETVVIQKFLDANTNGLIDGADLLVQQFNLTDGANSVIGGVTNFNVPGDLNSATGAITATLNFQSSDFVQNIVGKYLYKLSSPVSRFAPLTNGFSVTNFPYAQKFTGNVVSNSTSTTVSNAIVLLFPPPRSGHNGPGQPLGGTVANNSGAYAIQAPPGTYTLMSFKSNYVVNSKTAPVLTLGSGATINTNLTITNATASITGQIVDASNAGIALPGVFMPVSTTNGLIAVTFTDTNGNFTMRVTAGQWSVGSDDSGLVVHGYLGWNNGTNVNAGATGVTLAYPKANALLYGSIKDSLGNALAGIDANANDSSNLWQVGISSQGTPTNYVFSQPDIDQNGGTNLAVGQAVLQNFTAILATNHITGNVKDSGGTNIAGVGMFAYATINGTNYQTKDVDTDTNGNYSLNVANGTWSVSVNCYGGNDSLSQLGNYACPNNTNVTILNNNSVANFVVQICGGVVINTTSPLPVGEFGLFYDQFLQGSSCNGGLNWSQVSGSLPVGLSGNGELSGFPSGSGTFIFTVQASDGVNTTNKQFSISISNALQVTTASLPNGTNGASYGQQLQAINGVPYGGGMPYSWSLSSGSLPANLNLGTNGFLSGTLATNGLFNFTVQASDSLGAVVNRPLSLNVVSTNNVSFPPLTVGTGGGQIIVFWPASAGTNFTLQTTTNPATGPWVPATNGMPAVSFVFSNSQPAAFFRLH
jgi:hypothetical protein